MNHQLKTGSSFKFVSLSILAFGLIALVGCTELNDPYYSPPRGGYNDPYNHGYDRGYDRDYDHRDYDYHRDRELERERRETEHERQRLENERQRLEAERQHQNERQRVQERCPSGFQPSEQKCSPDERRRGCKDMRLPGGLGCVHR